MVQKTSLAAILMVLISGAVGLSVFLGPGIAEAAHGSSANFTFKPVDAPADRKPGIDDASYKQWAQSNVDIKSIDYFVIRWPDGDLGGCSESDVETLAIDRGDDQSGMGNDEGLLQYVEDSTREKHRVVVDFYDEEDLYDSTYLNQTDEIVAHQTECYGNPSDAGWYQVSATMNGTGWNDQQVEATTDSHYFWICDCATEQEAREQLGPPPSESTGSPTKTPTPDSSTPESTETTPNPSPTEADQTATPIDTTTPTPSAVDQTDVGRDSDGDQTTTGDDSGASGPTPGSGAGFGSLAAICGVFGTLLFLRVRREV